MLTQKEILLLLFEQSKLISLAQLESDFCPPQTVKSTEKYLNIQNSKLKRKWILRKIIVMEDNTVPMPSDSKNQFD